MPATTTFNFMLEAKYGSAVISGGSTTLGYKRIIINFGNSVEILAGGQSGKSMQTLQGKTNFSIPNTSGVPITIIALMSEMTIKGVPHGFFTPLLIEGKVYQATQKSNRTYQIECFHPVTKTKVCGMELWLANWQELK